MKKLTLMFALSFLVGCATSNVEFVPAYEEGAEVPPDHGILIARVINASPYYLPFNYLTIAPKTVNLNEEEKFQRLGAAKTIPRNSSLFASPVKPGQYSLSSIMSYFNFGNYYYQAYGATDPEFGTFKIEPGVVTDLGTLVYYHKIEGQNYHKVVARTDDEGETFGRLHTEYPEFLRSEMEEARASWDEDDLQDDRIDTFLNIVQNPLTYSQRSRLNNGDFLFLSKLGVMLRRDSAGDWSIDGVDTYYDLTMFDENSSGDQILMDGDNNLFIKKSGDDEWRKKRIDAGDLSLHDVVISESGVVYATLSDEYKLIIAEVSNLDTGELSNTKYYVRDHGWMTPATFASKESELELANAELKQGQKPKKFRKHKNFHTVEQQGNVLVAVDQQMYSVNMDNQTIEPIKSDLKVKTLGKVSDDQLVATSGTFIGSRQYSLDGGHSWAKFPASAQIDTCSDEAMVEAGKKSQLKCEDGKRRFKTMNFVGSPVFYLDNTGYAILSRSEVTDFWAGTRETNYYLGTTKDSGNHWAQEEEPLPELCTRLFKAQDEETLILSCDQTIGSFYSTDRSSISWQLEHRPTAF